MPSENLTVTIAHDYGCFWCWAALFQAKRLREEFSEIRQVWRGFELLPEELGPIPQYPSQTKDPNAAPSRFWSFAEAEGVPAPKWPSFGFVRTHDALEGAAYVQDKEPAFFEAYNEAVYRALWEHSENISELDVLVRVATAVGLDRGAFLTAVTTRAYSSEIVRFNDAAYAVDVPYVPTFIFRGQRCAEAPYETIRDLAQRTLLWYGE